MRESIIENRLVQKVKDRKGLCFKLLPFVNAGLPDRLVLLPVGKFYFVELKAPTGGLSPIQKLMHKKLDRIGFKVYVLYTTEEVDSFIKDIDDAKY